MIGIRLGLGADSPNSFLVSSQEQVLMENYTQEEEFNTQLSGDEQFERWNQQHSELQRQIEALERKPYVTEADDLEEQRLKKLKLQVKDRMNQMLSTQRRAAGA